MRRPHLLRFLCSLALSGLLGLAVACGPGPGKFVWASSLPEQPPQPAPVRIEKGDRLRIQVWGQQAVSGDYEVRQDGQITLPLIGDIAVAGLPPMDAGEQIKRRYEGIFPDAAVTVGLSDSPTQTVSVIGEVRTPGQIAITAGERLVDVLARVGGLTDFASQDGIYVLRKDGGLRIRFRYDELTRSARGTHTFVMQDRDVVVVE